jgi:hypothetical protein
MQRGGGLEDHLLMYIQRSSQISQEVTMYSNFQIIQSNFSYFGAGKEDSKWRDHYKQQSGSRTSIDQRA